MNIFLAELQEEDICTTMYAAQYKSRQKLNVSEMFVVYQIVPFVANTSRCIVSL